jgi:hypothetical protein
MVDERPETGSTQGSFIVMGVLTICIGLILTSVVYLLLKNNLILRSLASTIRPSGSDKGIMNVIMGTLILLTIMITIFGFRAILPNIMADKERQENAVRFMRERVIPISATIFFVLFLYQFMMGGRNVSASKELRDKMGLLLIVAMILAIVHGIRVIMSGGTIVRVLTYSGIGVGLVLLVMSMFWSYF